EWESFRKGSVYRTGGSPQKRGCWITSACYIRRGFQVFFVENPMRDSSRLLWLITGLVLGVGVTALYLLPSRQAQASNDRFEDYIICTGAVGVTPRAPTDGIWLLDYRSGKLLGTVVDRTIGKIVGWAEVDLVNEFNIPPRQNVHFLMTTGNI